MSKPFKTTPLAGIKIKLHYEVRHFLMIALHRNKQVFFLFNRIMEQQPSQGIAYSKIKYNVGYQ